MNIQYIGNATYKCQMELDKAFCLKFSTKVERRGCPQRHARDVLNGTLWVLCTGAPWKKVSQRYPPYQRCHRRFQHRMQEGDFKRSVHELAEDLFERGSIDIRDAFIDGTFAPAKKKFCCWKCKVRQSHQNSGSCRRFRSSYRPSLGKLFAARSKTGCGYDKQPLCRPYADRLIGDKTYDSYGLHH